MSKDPSDLALDTIVHGAALAYQIGGDDLLYAAFAAAMVSYIESVHPQADRDQVSDILIQMAGVGLKCWERIKEERGEHGGAQKQPH